MHSKIGVVCHAGMLVDLNSVRIGLKHYIKIISPVRGVENRTQAKHLVPCKFIDPVLYSNFQLSESIPGLATLLGSMPKVVTAACQVMIRLAQFK